jgi:hypothetical protein
MAAVRRAAGAKAATKSQITPGERTNIGARAVPGKTGAALYC